MYNSSDSHLNWASASSWLLIILAKSFWFWLFCSHLYFDHSFCNRHLSFASSVFIAGSLLSLCLFHRSKKFSFQFVVCPRLPLDIRQIPDDSYPGSFNSWIGISFSSNGFICFETFSNLRICFSIFLLRFSSRALTIAGSIFFFFFRGSALEVKHTTCERILLYAYDPMFLISTYNNALLVDIRRVGR